MPPSKLLYPRLGMSAALASFANYDFLRTYRYSDPSQFTLANSICYLPPSLSIVSMTLPFIPFLVLNFIKPVRNGPYVDTDTTYPSSYADNGTVSWSTTTLSDDGSLEVSFPSIRYNYLFSSNLDSDSQSTHSTDGKLSARPKDGQPSNTTPSCTAPSLYLNPQITIASSSTSSRDPTSPSFRAANWVSSRSGTRATYTTYRRRSRRACPLSRASMIFGLRGITRWAFRRILSLPFP